MVRLGLRESSVLQAVQSAALRELHDYTISDIASLLWGMAKAGVEAPDFFAKVGDQAAPLVAGEERSSALAMLIWSFGKASVRHDVFFAAVNAKNTAARFACGLTCQELSNAAWATAKLGYQCEEMLKAVAKEACVKAAGFSCGEMSNIIWAFAQASIVDEALFRAIAREALPRLSEFNPQQQYNLLWGFLLAYTRDVGIYHCGCGRVLVRI
jgi:hypothetical protein